MAYVGTPIDTTNQFQSLQGKRFSGNASTTAFTLDIAPNSVFDIEVFVENVRQDPNSAYTLNGTTLTFSAAPPSGTNNIYVIHQAKAVGTITAPVGGSIDMNGVELILDEDGDTSITADTDDQIDFKTGGTDRVAINSSGQVIVGGTSAENSSVIFEAKGATNPIIQVEDTTNNIRCGLQAGNSNAVIRCPQDNDLAFVVGAAEPERMRIVSDGDVLIAQTSRDFGAVGHAFRSGGEATHTRDGNPSLSLNRLNSDGTIQQFGQGSTIEGTVSVSGTTVSYNGFTGTHWSRLSDNSKPTILKGTILESLDEMCDWYQAVADVAESTDEEGNITPAHQVKKSIALGSRSVGDSITFTYNGVEHTGTIVKEGDVKHTKSKVSDTVDAKNVYGVFVAWDNDDDTVNDMYVAQTGTFVVRMNSTETVSKGDLIQSNGDGTGKVQADDIIRASTVAKVLSTTKIETYSDGSYIVPCSLHC